MTTYCIMTPPLALSFHACPVPVALLGPHVHGLNVRTLSIWFMASNSTLYMLQANRGFAISMDGRQNPRREGSERGPLLLRREWGAFINGAHLHGYSLPSMDIANPRFACNITLSISKLTIYQYLSSITAFVATRYIDAQLASYDSPRVPERTQRPRIPKTRKGMHDVKYANKQRILIGRDLGVKLVTDLMEGLPEGFLDRVVDGATPSQKTLFKVYLRHIINNITLIRSPYGTGETSIIKFLAEIMK